MRVLSVRNVAEALPAGLAYLAAEGRWEATRAGRAIVAPGPVATVYTRPRERVLFSALRDANPFFHLAESLWMLAGRRDAAFLNNFVKDFGARFAEPDGIIHDAYGARWREHFDFDQLDMVVTHLSGDPGSRQAVLQMWDTDEDWVGGLKTRPCNTHAYLRVRKRELGPADGSLWKHDDVLDITVLCRSNDIVWGAYGANAVHFSVLQEYLAARLDLGVGTYVQFSHNYHCYEDQWQRLTVTVDHGDIPSGRLFDNRYSTPGLTPLPLVHDVDLFDAEIARLLHWYENGRRDLEKVTYDRDKGLEAVWADHDFGFHNHFLSRTVWPMLVAHHLWREKRIADPMVWVDRIEAADWRAAATEWIQRRTK